MERKEDTSRPRRINPRKVPKSKAVLFTVLAGLAWVEAGRLLPGTGLSAVCAAATVFLALDLAVRFLANTTVVDGVHLLYYGKWTPHYIASLVNAPNWVLNNFFKEKYHGKVLTYEHAKQLVKPEFDVPLCDLGERIVPWKEARDFIAKANIRLGLYDCPCRLSKPVHCTPTMVCLVGFGAEDDAKSPMEALHGKERFRRIDRDEALQILDEEHKRGHVHTAYFKDLCGDKFFALCNCCKCCCGGIELMMKRGFRSLASSGFVANVHTDGCIGCGACERICAFGAITVVPSPDGAVNAQGKPRKIAVVDQAKCMGCGACEVKCPKHTIELVRDPSKGDPLDMRSLKDLDW